MNAFLVAVLILAASVAFLAAPALGALEPIPPSRGRAMCVLLVQFLPAALVIAYLWYAEFHLRIPVFSYRRPTFGQVLAAAALLQLIATASILWKARLSLAKKSFLAAAAVLASIGVAAVSSEVLACANHDCF